MRNKSFEELWSLYKSSDKDDNIVRAIFEKARDEKNDEELLKVVLLDEGVVCFEALELLVIKSCEYDSTKE